MDRYSKTNAVEKIHGYYLPTASISAEKTFERAKDETIRNLRLALVNIEAVNFEMFSAELKSKGIRV